VKKKVFNLKYWEDEYAKLIHQFSNVGIGSKISINYTADTYLLVRII